MTWTLDMQALINVSLGALVTIMVWLAGELYSAVKELKQDLAKLREDLPKTYVLKEDYRRDLYEIKDLLGKIWDKLDGKADK
jgi:hypothetical protein